MCDDVLRLFDDILKSKSFNSWDVFEDAFKQFNKVAQTHYVVRRSRIDRNNPILRYERVDYVCTFGQKRRSRSEGVRPGPPFKCMGCTSSFSVNSVNGSLVVGDMRGEHNHPCTQEYMMVDHSRRNLSGMQRVIVDSMVECMISTFELRNTVLIKFGKYISRQDIVKLKQKMTAGMDSMHSVLQLLRSTGEVRTKSSNGQLDVICFSLHEQIKFYESFPEVICIDSTYKTNNLGFSLFQLVVTDGCGKGASVMFAFCRRETVADITHVLRMFQSIMGYTDGTKTFVMDNCQAEISSVKEVFPHCRIILSSFHVLRAFGRKFRNPELRYALEKLVSTRIRPKFQNQFKSNWTN
uniref:ZSWIM1/3 RNaseH-like domain-containing protein n=1 Tax=Trichobilharzia regenti TaxID=157069 RepID=A0AA85ITG1_TRIRE|nr:unnamed protein product [Trichobilharzia regenti]